MSTNQTCSEHSRNPDKVEERTCRICKRLRSEHRNVRQVVAALIKAGYAVALDYGEEGFAVEPTTTIAKIMAEVGACDEEWLRTSKLGQKPSFVFLVYGNADDGSEVVSDYGMSLDPILQPILESWG